MKVFSESSMQKKINFAKFLHFDLILKQDRNILNLFSSYTNLTKLIPLDPWEYIIPHLFLRKIEKLSQKMLMWGKSYDFLFKR